MKYKLSVLLIILLSSIGISLIHSPNEHVKKSTEELNPSLGLWYDQPAYDWTEALPVGNGRLGAMVYGGVAREKIQFNEETLWSGQPHDYAHEGAWEVLDELRQLLWDGNQKKAHNLGNERFMSQPFGQLCYQPFEDVTDYMRKLDLENAVTSITYKSGEIIYNREIIASFPDQAIIMQLESSSKNALNFSVGMNSPHENYDIEIEEQVIVIKGKANNYPEELGRDGNPYPESKLTFEARIKVICDGGDIIMQDEKINVENATSATLHLVAATSFVNYNDISGDPSSRCKNYLDQINDKSYFMLKKDHIEDYQRLFKRVNLDLGSSEISSRSTNDRLNTFKLDEDASLVSLLFQYGRYLLIASSREGTQPANLQGIWNDRMAPPWDSKYTININTEMNYWPAGITNLSEMSDPLIRMVEDLSITGQNVAKEHYNLNGWVTHHNTDIWRGAAPINNANHGIWVSGGAWLCQHLWWHYQFTGDKTYLKDRAYPVLKEASSFFMNYLVPYPDHPEWLVSGPSNSPELGGLVMAPTMDHQIIRNLFANTIEAAEILGIDQELVEILKEKHSRIAPNLIGQYGQLQEWLEDKDDPENEHRHVSHLWGLHPGNEIHPKTTPELAEACKVTLSQRGDGGTGWSRAWKINFWARLLDGDHAFLLLKNLMVPSRTTETNMRDKGGLYANLFDAHPPFQIDGNFGATSGITEMLLQSHLRDEKGDFYLDILPALPSALSAGSVKGIKGRGGFEVFIIWNENKLTSVEILSLNGNNLNLRYDDKLISTKTVDGETYTYSEDDFK
jgi:alpha-L-fucosidase 2